MRYIKKFFSYARPYLWLLILALFCGILQVGAQLLAPVFIGNAIDYIIGKNNVNFDKILYYIVFLSVTISIAVIFQYLSAYFASLCTHKTIHKIRGDAFKKINRLPLKESDKTNHGDLIMRVTADAQRVSDGLIQGFTQLFTGVLTILGTLAFMLSLNVLASLAVVLITPLSIIVAFFIAKSGQKNLTRQVKSEGVLGGFTEEYITNQRLVKLYNFEAKSQEKFEEVNGQIKKYGTRAVFLSAIVNPSTRLINGFVYAFTCVIGAVLIINVGDFSVGLLSIFLSYALQYSKPFNEITGVITEMQAAIVSSKRLFEILESEPEPDESRLPSLLVKDGSLEFKNAEFSYNEAPFIKDFNLKINSGQRVAVVGRTGSGKTTLLSLIMRFYEINGGEIEVDTINTSVVSRDSVRSNIGMVLQDTWLFKGTIKENIAYGKTNATDEEIMNAAQKAKIDGFINGLKDGYNTIIDPLSLSQGQAQLISIARVFLCLPPIIILDEATSSIDARTELKIQEAFKEMTKGHTSFIVAHRLNTIKEADIILVMEKGRIAEQGTHRELLALNGIYTSLLTALEETP